MSKNFFELNVKKVHFIGIGGISMSALALYLLDKGYQVTGSDIVESDAIDKLRNAGAKIFIGHKQRNVFGVEAVVLTSAVEDNNPELKFAKRKKLPIIKRSELLGDVLSKYKVSVAVSGCHGKTTTTAMIAKMLICADKSPTVFLGGESLDFGNCCFGDGDIALAEACEFKKNILNLYPKISVVLNIDNDHMDSYKDMEDLTKTYADFITGTIAVINADDKPCEKIYTSTTVTFGIEKLATYSARRVKFNGEGYSFNAYAYSMFLGSINLSVLGKHNIYNALATIAVGDLLKIPFSKVKRALEDFKGVKRRAEYLGSFGKKKFYGDYAHHPNEIKATLNAFKEQSESFRVVFQPHTYSRTKLLMQQFVEVLKDYPDTIIYATYPARESFDKGGSALTLFENLSKLENADFEYIASREELKSAIEKTIKSQRILFLGAGNIYEIAKSLIP